VKVEDTLVSKVKQSNLLNKLRLIKYIKVQKTHGEKVKGKERTKEELRLAAGKERE